MYNETRAGSKAALRYVCGLYAHPRFKPVTKLVLHVARVRVEVVALTVIGLITRRRRSRNVLCCCGITADSTRTFADN